MFILGLNTISAKRAHLPNPRLGLPSSRVLILISEIPVKIAQVTAAYPCTILEIVDRRAMHPTWDRGGATPE